MRRVWAPAAPVALIPVTTHCDDYAGTQQDSKQCNARTWEHTVARAAPLMPSPAEKIRK